MDEERPRHRPQGKTRIWVTNVRRRVYDALNVQMAAGFLILNDQDLFEISKDFDSSLWIPEQPQNEPSKITESQNDDKVEPEEVKFEPVEEEIESPAKPTETQTPK